MVAGFGVEGRRSAGQTLWHLIGAYFVKVLGLLCFDVGALWIVATLRASW